MPLPAAAFPLRTSGARILAADGEPVTLGLGVNWGGAHQDEAVPYGLDVLDRAEIISRIADEWGMTHVRFPFSVGGFVTPAGKLLTAAAPAGRLDANPDLKGMTAWQVYQRLVADMTTGRAAAGKNPLYVVLNQHLLHPGWCCSTADGNGLWYNANWPAGAFTACWKIIATALAANPHVGYDIHNEPRDTTISGTTRHPTWGDGNPLTDFRHMYSDMAGTIRAIDHDALIICEGLSYASDLTAAGAHPVTAPGLPHGGPGIVYSAHDYPWFHQHADKTPQTRAEYFAVNDKKWGYLATQGKAPVWVGEFGSNTDAADAAFNSGWFPDFMAYYAERPLAGACWWELSATGVLGTEPSTNAVKVRAGQREGFGLMAGQDGRGSQTATLARLAPIAGL